MDGALRRLPACAAIVLVLAILAPAPVAGHAELVSTTPGDGAELDRPPHEIVLVFDAEIDPEASEFTVTDATGAEVGRGEVDLTVAERNVMRGAVRIDGPAQLTVAWSAAAADGHAAEGTFGFSIVGADADANPDTALPAPASPPLVLLGLVLLGAAFLARRTVP